MNAFEPSRSDGHSDRQLIFELVRHRDPDTMFKYAELQKILEIGTDRKITRTVIGAAVRSANPTLLREVNRVLAVVKTVGYRLVRADEHVGLALVRKDRAEVMFRRGVEVLQGTRIDELDEPHRTLHQGTLMVMRGFYEALRTTQKRQATQERVIQQLVQRVTKLEEQN